MQFTRRRFGQTLLAGIASGALGSATAQGAAQAEAPTPRLVGGDKQLFIDHRFIEAKENITLVVNPPVKHSEAILHSDRPWDAFRLIYFSIAEEGGRYTMWYQAFDADQWDGTSRSRLCYAVSQDGMNWEKPSLGLVEYAGSTDNNILLNDKTLAYVFRDPHGAPGEPYKMIYGHDAPGTMVAVSPDGIHWRLPKISCLPPGPDTQKQAWWDERLNKYVVYLRVMVDEKGQPAYPFVSPIDSDPPVVAPRLMRRGRALGRVAMDDITEPWPVDQIRTVLAADELDPLDSDIYHHNVYPYPYAADAYFMFPLTYQHFDNGETNVGNDGVNDVQFAASRDGIHWMRYGRAPYLARGLPGEPDGGMISATGFHIRKGDYLYHYYTAWPWTHGGFRLLTPEQRQDKANWGRQHYGVAVQRLDGFVSADAPYGGGWLTTPPIVFRGNRLSLNIDVAALGEARIEIQDIQGRPLPGFTIEDCNRILFNDVDFTVKWKGKQDVSAVSGQPVRLRIALRSAKLYAFQFAAET